MGCDGPIARLPTLVRRLVVPLAGIAVLAVVEPSVLTGTARSPRALLVIAGAVALTALAGRLVGRRFGPRAAAATRLAVVGVTLWVLLVPALRQETLDEELPGTTVAAGGTAGIDVPGGADAVADGPAPGPVTTGDLEGIGHHATGTVTVHRLDDGTHVVRFEDVDIRGTPDPVLYLVPGHGARTREGGADLGSLKATRGTFHHEVPTDFDLDRDFSVFVWCGRFAVPIANADQRPV
jgi:hypothetical protein